MCFNKMPSFTFFRSLSLVIVILQKKVKKTRGTTHPGTGVYALLLEDSHLGISVGEVKAGMVDWLPAWLMLNLASAAEPRRHS